MLKLSLWRRVTIFILSITLVGCGQQNSDETAVNASTILTPTVTETVATDQITITSQLFEPQIITVKKGTMVTWTNTDSVGHWLASDPYPIHTGLSGFDSGQAVSAGGSYQFTFNRVGEWFYHDHLRPVTYTGRVIVTE